jgi:hypothetical protein
MEICSFHRTTGADVPFLQLSIWNAQEDHVEMYKYRWFPRWHALLVGETLPLRAAYAPRRLTLAQPSKYTLCSPSHKDPGLSPQKRS